MSSGVVPVDRQRDLPVDDLDDEPVPAPVIVEVTQGDLLLPLPLQCQLNTIVIQRHHYEMIILLFYSLKLNVTIY